MIWYVDPANGSDANNGQSWGSAKKSMRSIPTASVAPGDEVRFAKSADSVLLGQATVTDGSTSVTLSSSAPAWLTTSHLLSRATTQYMDPHPWYGVTTISGTSVTLKRPYRGASGTFDLYARLPVLQTAATVTAHGWGPDGTTIVNGTRQAPIVISGGWDTGSGQRNGQTFLDGAGCARGAFIIHGDFTNVSRFSWCRYGSNSLAGFVVNGGSVEIDNAIEDSGYGVTMGSGMSKGGVGIVNVASGNKTDGVHYHTVNNCYFELRQAKDNGNWGWSQDIDWEQRNTFLIGECEFNGDGVSNMKGGSYGGGYVTANTFDIQKLASNPPIGHWILECPREDEFGPVNAPAEHNYYCVRQASGNGTDLGFSGVYGSLYLFDCNLGSTTGLLTTEPDLVVTTVQRPASAGPHFLMTSGALASDSQILRNGQASTRFSCGGTFAKASMARWTTRGTANRLARVTIPIRQSSVSDGVAFSPSIPQFVRLRSIGALVKQDVALSPGNWQEVTLEITPTQDSPIDIEVYLPNYFDGASSGLGHFVNLGAIVVESDDTGSLSFDPAMGLSYDGAYAPPGPMVPHSSPVHPRLGLGYVTGPNRITREMARRKGRRRRVQS